MLSLDPLVELLLVRKISGELRRFSSSLLRLLPAPDGLSYCSASRCARQSFAEPLDPRRALNTRLWLFQLQF